jgi:hypothetical protein
LPVSDRWAGSGEVHGPGNGATTGTL